MKHGLKVKILNVLLIILSLFGYLEWGEGNQQYLFDIEYEVVSKLLTNPIEALHPLIVIPLVGQMLLAYTLYQEEPSKILTYLGIGCIGLLMIFILIAGISGMNQKIILSTLPFILMGIYTVLIIRKSDN